MTAPRTLALLAAAAALALAAPKAGNPKEGKAVFDEQCAACHNAASSERKMGPGLKGLFKRVKLANGRKVTDQTVRARIDAGGGGMPAYNGILSEEQKSSLMAYLKTL